MSRRRRVTLSIIGVLAVCLVAVWFVALAPLEAINFTETPCGEQGPCVSRVDGGIVALPSDDEANRSVGFVFYTGARVVPEAYAPVAERVAAAGFAMWIPELTINFAVLDQDAAAEVIAGNPEIQRWIIVGHSLGGAMAARYAPTDDRVAGLALLAAYPEAGLDLSGSDLAVASIYGTEDGLATTVEVLEAGPRLPPNTDFVAIEGGNHAQFGNYGGQRGDKPATVSAETQWDATAAALIGLAGKVDPAS